MRVVNISREPVKRRRDLCFVRWHLHVALAPNSATVSMSASLRSSGAKAGCLSPSSMMMAGSVAAAWSGRPSAACSKTSSADGSTASSIKVDPHHGRV